jgi:hypothetical protein
VTAFSTEEGAFLRGQVIMEDHLDLGLDADEKSVNKPAIENISDQEAS